MKSYEDVRKLAAAFKGNLMKWPGAVIDKIHIDILEEDLSNPDPDLLTSIDEAAEIIEKAADLKEAESRIKSLKGNQYTKNLACWLGGNLGHLEFAEETFREMRKKEHTSLFHILQESHARFKRQVGMSLLNKIIDIERSANDS